MVADRRDSVGRMRVQDVREALKGMGQDTRGRAEHLRDRLRAARAVAAAEESTDAVKGGPHQGEQHHESEAGGERSTREDHDDGAWPSSSVEREGTASSADPTDLATASNNNRDTAQLSPSTILTWWQTHPILTPVAVAVLVICIISFVYWFRSGSDTPPSPRQAGGRPNGASPLTTSTTSSAAGPMVARYSSGTVMLVNAWQQDEAFRGL